MKTVLCIILYLLIGVFLALAPVLINKGIFEYSDFYEYRDESSRFYEYGIEHNACYFAIILFFWPVLGFVSLVAWIFGSIGKGIMKLHKKTKKR